MGREIRMVPENWEHPKENGRYRPLLSSSYEKSANEFLKMIEEKGLQEAVEYFGGGPDKNDYMPEWTEEEKTHVMMYETCSEGTPISPAFKTCEELAMWLYKNKASAFGNMTASYEDWLVMCQRGWAPSAAFVNGSFISGVALK